MAELSKAIARLMEERERVGPPVAAAEAPKLRELLDAVRPQVLPGERSLLDAFTRQLFERAGTDLLAEASTSQLAAVVLSAFRLIAERSTDEPRVLAYDPDLTPAGWETPATVIETVMRDRPFIVDTVQECLRQSGCTVRRLIHPVFGVERDARGTLLAIGAPAGLGRKESFVHVELDRVPERDAVANLIRRHLSAVVLACDDYPAMRSQAEKLATELRTRSLQPPWNTDITEIADFIEWLGRKNFVFLGYREYQFAGQGAERTAAVRRGSGRGILCKEERSSFATARVLPDVLRRRLSEPPLLLISKTNAESPIHRRAHMEYIGLKEVDNAGVVVGERRFLGLFTSRAYNEPAAMVPLLRRKLSAILAIEGVAEDSHDYKAIVATLDTIPKVEALAASVPQLRAEIKTILAAEGGTDVKVVQRPDALGRGLFVVVILPRGRFSEELYRRLEAHLAQALSAAAVLDQRLALDDFDQVRMHFYFAGPETGLRPLSTDELRALASQLLRNWDDRLQDALREHYPREQARALAERYAAAFSGAYKASTDVPLAVRDIRCLEALVQSRQPQIDVVNDATEPRFTALKLYLAEEELVLGDFLPVLEDLGLKVFSEFPLDVSLPEIGHVRIHTFFVQDSTGARLDVERAAPLLQPALLMLHAGRIESDHLNSLLLSAGLDWRQIDLLRTYVNHGLQIGSASSRGALVQALSRYPRSAQLLWEYFGAKFDPSLPAAPRQRLATLPEVEQRFLASLDAVQSVMDDRILRALFSAMAATLRTNFFCAPPEGATGTTVQRTALAIKLESARIPHLPRPHPLYETYVHAPHMEGVHVRGAKVARGGIRLSERPDDFRTEILDLMKTQMIKNAVIVPAGAKGGFIVKARSPHAASSAEVVSAYRTFISTLLHITDNIVQGRLQPPADMLAYDDPDPYLVVAADKGTATFSDIANEVAAQHHFWLGDAFASGGTHGYDHKKEGITARGAWESVRRHFRALGRDADRERLTVIGIGDMSGDVFGNGMLLSRQLCLRAAFNHQHLFLDPDPDPALSFAERERLFELPRSAWSDYNARVISSGGGVFPRNAKKIPLSPEVRAMLGVDVESASGEEVISAILRMEADLLWNGGIGTYVKATDETHAMVGDSTNDAVRVDAAELRVKVVAEGGNLGFTQAGRVEYALRGGRINTDAIDNSAGVDMSDHEVNLKIALAGAVESGELDVAERNRLLTELTPEVTERVLAHNRRQARALSLDQLRSQTRLNDFRDLMIHLESEGLLDRHLEGLPEREGLRNRRGIFLGLTHPELAVLLAHSKLALQQWLLASTAPDDAFFETFLRSYFPAVVNARFGTAVRTHRLRREIIAVELANALVDTMGAAFITRVSRDTGREPVSIARAWAVAVGVGGAHDILVQLGSTEPPLPLAAEARCWLAVETALESATKWVVETQPNDEPATELSRMLSAPTQELLAALPAVSPPAVQTAVAAAADALASLGTPRQLAQRIAALDRLSELFEIVCIAADSDLARPTAAEVYYRVGELVDLDWVRQSLATLQPEDRWERRAVEGLAEGLIYARRQLTQNVLGYSGRDVSTSLKAYVNAEHEQLGRLAALINDVKSARRPTLAALVVVMRELGRLLGRGD